MTDDTKSDELPAYAAAAADSKHSRQKVILIMALVLVLGTIATVVANAGRVAPIVQPLAFNHAIHTEMNTTCDVCHKTAMTGQAAGRPSAEICAECHDIEDDPVNESAAVAELRTYLKSGARIPWRRLMRLADDVRFHHGRHVTIAQIPCERCHGDIGTSTSPPSAASQIFTMDDCLECHVQEGASEDCLACHR